MQWGSGWLRKGKIPTRIARLSLVMLLFLCGAAILLLTWYYSRMERQLQARLDTWDQILTTPMPEDMVRDFCNQNLMPEEVADCDAAEVVITYHAIPTIFSANIDSNSTHEDVRSMFGKYERYCEHPNQFENSNTYRCKYEFGRRSLYIRFDKGTDVITELHWYNPAYGS